MSLHTRCGAVEAVLHWAMLYIMLSVRWMVFLITLFLFSTGAEGSERNQRRNGTIWFKPTPKQSDRLIMWYWVEILLWNMIKCSYAVQQQRGCASLQCIICAARKQFSTFGRNIQKEETLFHILVHFGCNLKFQPQIKFPWHFESSAAMTWWRKRWLLHLTNCRCQRSNFKAPWTPSRSSLCAFEQNPTGWVRINTPAHRPASRRLSP